MAGTRRLLARLRELMAAGGAASEPVPATVLAEVGSLVAIELAMEVCSIYAMRPGDMLELCATHGLNQDAVRRTRLRVGEGIVGICAATGQVQNLPDAQNHPGFAYRPETGEEPYASLLAIPIRRAGRTHGVLAVQNVQPRRYLDDEVEVLQTVAMLLAEVLATFGAPDGAQEGFGATLPRSFEANALAPGIAVGPVVVLGSGPSPRRLLADDPATELARIEAALKTMRRDLDQLIEDRIPEGDAPREVLEATRLVAADNSWSRRIGEAIRGGLTAEAAVHRVTGELRNRMRRVVDPYIRERVADLEDLGTRLLSALDGEAEQAPVPPGAILLARRLGPAQLLQWHARGIAGVVIEEGTPAGHAAILARALDLPALGGARGVIEATEPGDDAVLDADEERVVLRPEADVRQAYQRALEAQQLRQAGLAMLRDVPARTRDGTDFKLMLNVGLRMELDQLERTGAAGIGLFRTEIAMLARGRIVDVPEQAAIYARVLEAAGDRPVRFRTLDLGGDKLLPDAPPQEEDNPAMGWRSLRIGLDRPALLRRQLRALLLAAGGRPLSVMFPMVATVAEFRAARGLLYTEAARVRPAPARLEIGAMLEIPALLWQLPALLAEADFISVGSNDLMQFLFAADRGTPAITGRYDLLSAPVLDLLEGLATAARQAGREVSLCGEHAARPLDALVLAAVGITTLSMPSSSLLRVKSLLLEADLVALRAVLSSLRRGRAAQASLREPISAWAREHGLRV